MQYPHSREESAALLKRVITEMGQHDAPFDPLSYAVWYEHMAGINPALSQDLEQARQQQPRLDAQAIARLYHGHVAEPDAETTRAARGQFEKIMSDVAEQAQATGRHARVYGHQLAGLSRALQGDDPSPQAAAIQPHLTEVADGTQRMQAAVANLSRTVAEGQGEIERLRLALDRSRTEAITDALSQLLNRKGFDEALRQMLARPAASGRAHCLVMLDIDHFKRVNDAHGHPVGDTVIQTLGLLLRRVASGEDQHAARVGGEEFALLLADSTLAQAQQQAQQVQALLRGTRIRKRGVAEPLPPITLSAGVAALSAGDDALSLMAAADAALYRSKEAGRDRVTVA